MPKQIAVLGSTGSIGVQTLDAARRLPDIRVAALAAHSDIGTLHRQILEFAPDVASVADVDAAEQLRRILGVHKTKIYSGPEGVVEAARHGPVDIVVNAVVGSAGLMPTLAAIDAGKAVALANKETLVAAGELVMNLARAKNVPVVPVDSEHSAIFQCIQGNKNCKIDTIYLTASGGPFRGKSKDDLRHVTAADALQHPNWKMGKKVTIDSATLMNKGLEVIEAVRLFNVTPEQIKVLVHPQSAVHSMVGFEDGAVMAQLGVPDMRVPIQYALTWPDRAFGAYGRLDFIKTNTLTFEEPDMETFECLALAYLALKTGGTMPAAMSMADEIAVELFLNDKIKFLDIPALIRSVMEAHIVKNVESAEDVTETELWVRDFIKNNYAGRFW